MPAGARSALEAAVSTLAPGGAGVAHVVWKGERRAVFVPHAAPGDRLRIAADMSVRPARAEILEVVSPGPDRVEPACPWSTRCGGCDWMHLSLEAQARAHAEHVRAALPGTWREATVGSVPARGGLAYRTRARVHVRCGRGGRIAVGMYGAGSHEPVEVAACAVLDPALDRARRALGSLFEGSRGRGDVHLALGAGRLPVYDVRWKGHLGAETFARLEQAVRAGTIAGGQVTIDDSRRPARVGDATPWVAGADGVPLRLAPGGFGQASEHANAALAVHVAGLAEAGRPGKAVELYAGSGNLSILLARAAAELVCVEASREACDAARANLAARALSARVVEGDAEAYAWREGTDLLVLDPPRGGARAVAQRLAGSRVRRVVYVSCDTRTLARDLALLEASYVPTSVTAFEMFPQTSHVETVLSLERRRS